jgi:hypothetical protein
LWLGRDIAPIEGDWIMDSSAVFHAEMTDTDTFNYDPAMPWILDTDEGWTAFKTEEEACAAQRDYRRANGYHPITGEWIPA